jgi:hypothetical protein
MWRLDLAFALALLMGIFLLFLRSVDLVFRFGIRLYERLENFYFICPLIS